MSAWSLTSELNRLDTASLDNLHKEDIRVSFHLSPNQYTASMVLTASKAQYLWYP